MNKTGNERKKNEALKAFFCLYIWLNLSIEKLGFFNSNHKIAVRLPLN